MSEANLKPGSTVYSVATGRVSIFSKASRDAVKYVSKLDGIIGVNVHDDFTLWFFDSANNAKMARNLMEDKGIACGKNICEFRVADDGVPEMVGGIE